MNSVEVEKLKGTAAKLAEYVTQNSTYEFEGYFWLKSTRILIASQLNVNERTIRRVLEKHHNTFRYLDLLNSKEGKYVLLRVGSGMCQSDHVAFLRRTWVHGLVFFNADLARNLKIKLNTLPNFEFAVTEQQPQLVERLENHIAKAMQGASNLEKLKAGEKISLTVQPSHMGYLRGIVQIFGEDAQEVLKCVVKYDGWEMFMARIKAEERETKFYHWPNLPVVLKNPDIALETYLTTLQSEGSVPIKEANRLMTKIAKLQKQTVAKG
ncbi:hypothetical protein [Pseudochrobactrum lubricantis]|uniref:hypothetical protein n=1 Tax=Pseudochrobactrum lubricantis TaxID=558172 RepID=UPI0035E26018